jgi:hypothetical protein
MGKLGEQIAVIALAIIGVATLAVILSKNSNTTNVITASAQGFSRALATALSPITGGTGSGSLSGFGGSF